MVLHMHTTSSECRVTKLVELQNPKTGAMAKGGPVLRFLLKDQVACVEVHLERPLCMEVLAGTCLNRFVLRMNGVIVAIGNVQKVLDC